MDWQLMETSGNHVAGNNGIANGGTAEAARFICPARFGNEFYSLSEIQNRK